MNTIYKLRAGKYKIPVLIEKQGERLFLQFPFNRVLLNEVKTMKGARWHGYDEVNPRKVWSITDCPRNWFQINFLAGKNVYEHYDKPLLDIIPSRGVKSEGGICYSQQVEFFQHQVTRRQCITAGEMGTGKTLATIETMEYSGLPDWWWIGPRSALTAVKLDFNIWQAKVRPMFMTYDGLRKLIKEREECGFTNFIIPNGIVFDESTKIKSPTAQRSQAADIITDLMRKKNPNCFIIELTGAPAPKSPADWHHQCEIACPGFLREGNIDKFKQRLALIKEKESIIGGTYPELVTWLDDINKCKICGQLADKHTNGFGSLTDEADHKFEQSVNEVAKLYERMKGLVLVKFKKDCLKELPDKQFRLIRLEPSESVKRAAEIIIASSSRAIQALISLRELSDGFQYQEVELGSYVECPRCFGRKETEEWYDPDNSDTAEAVSPEAIQSGRCKQQTIPCPHCNAKGQIAVLNRTAKEIPCPKEKLLIDLLDEFEDARRFVTFSGFEASVDRCVRTSIRYGWDVLRLDGRGWCYFNANGEQVTLTDVEMLQRFQDKSSDKSPDKVNFVGNPGAAGMGLTLTASPAEFFYSNSYNGEDRIQAMDRIHRIGMDLNAGATIIDCVHLPIDQKILDNLNKKIDLQNMSMGALRDMSNEANTIQVERSEYYS